MSYSRRSPGTSPTRRCAWHGRAYLLGLLSQTERKNGWTLAEFAGDVSPDRLQRLLNFSPWDEDACRNALSRYVVRHLGDHARAAGKAREAADLLAAAGETEHAAFWRYIQAHALFDRGRPEDLAAARVALEDATANGPRTAWFRRLGRTVADLQGHERTADDTDRFFLAWDEWRREAGGRLDRALSDGRALLAGSHDEQCEGLKVLARLAGASGERPPKTEQSATDCRWTWSTVKELSTSSPGVPLPGAAIQPRSMSSP